MIVLNLLQRVKAHYGKGNTPTHMHMHMHTHMHTLSDFPGVATYVLHMCFLVFFH